jgi:multiple antibiotic resistance protein
VSILAQSAAVAFLALFPLVNPFGAIPVFVSLTSGDSPSEVRQTTLKVAFYVVAILVVFFFLGGFVLGFFGISLPVIKIAGGLLVAKTAWAMATGTSRITPDERREAHEAEDIAFSPMAMPMLSGPGAIGEVMGLAANANGAAADVGSLLGIAGIGVLTYLFLYLGGPLVTRLGKGAVGSIDRIFGFLILAIAVQLVTTGLTDLHVLS